MSSRLAQVLQFLLQTAAQITSFLTAKGAGSMGYQQGAGNQGEGYYGNVAGTIKRFLMDGDATVTPNASTTVAGSVEIADAVEIAAGTDTGGTGATLAVTPSQLKAVSDNAVQLAEDLSNTTIAPRVAQSTSDTGLLFRNVLNTISARIKAVTGGLAVRNAADNAFANLEAQNITAGGDVTIQGNLTVQGTTTAVNTTNMEVTDNIVTINDGEAGAGVSLGDAGIEVDRGSAPEGMARLLFNELAKVWRVGIGSLMFQIARKYDETIAAAAATTHVITHNLNTKNVTISVFDGDNIVYCDIETTTTDTVTLGFGVPITGYRVVITG